MSKFAAQISGQISGRIAAFGWTRAMALAAVAALALYRLAPHVPNLAPVGAMFVLGGLYLGRKPGWLAAPFVGLLATDAVLNAAWDGRPFHPERVADYLAFGLIAAAAVWAGRRSLGWRIGAVVASPVAFFAISNLGVWATAGMFPNTVPYPHTAQGLVDCYVAALPFFRGTLFGDWLFAGAGMLMLEGMKAREVRTAPALAA